MWQVIDFLMLICIARLSQVYGYPLDVKARAAAEFILLHNNDLHARFAQVNAQLTTCQPHEAEANECFGGFARVAHEVRRCRAKAKSGGLPVIYLNAGDIYFGTLWYNIFRYNITAAFLNKLKPDVMALGNHEFDDDIAGAVPLFEQLKFPMVASNMDVSKVPELAAIKNLVNSTVLEVNGTKVGVIGYITPETSNRVPANTVKFKPEIAAINNEATKLKSRGINIIIALGHSGYHKDIEIAANCPDVDIVVGAHSHTLLGRPTITFGQQSRGSYPTIIKQKGGRVVPVVQLFAYTVYLGKLHLQFDKYGELVGLDSKILLLDHQVPEDKDMLELLDVYRPNVTAVEQEISACEQNKQAVTPFCKCMQSHSKRVLKDCHLLL